MIRLIEQEQMDGPSNDQSFLEKVAEIFEEGGWLEKALGFEYRKEQAQMAQRYAKSLNEGKHLLFEAGTGVGKSLAYLIPSILFARFARRTCVVATNTINLQEQLLEKDVLSVRELFNRVPGLETIADFKCALLVGRANYLCQNRLSRALMGQGDLFESYQRDEVQRIAEWVDSGAVEGIRQELSPPPNPLVWDFS
jgi:ATP-dependent DNA helicase DinG